MALLLLCFTQCKPSQEEECDENTQKVRVNCVIPINDDRSDFTYLMANGKINWSDGVEYVFLAIHGDNPQIVRLEGWSDGYRSKMEFSAEIDKNLIVFGQEYDLWYLGHLPQVTVTGNAISGDLSHQSGNMLDLGKHHLAKATVIATKENGEIKLKIKEHLQNQIAIVLLNLFSIENMEDTYEIYGNVPLSYTLEYNEDIGKYEFVTHESNKPLYVHDDISFLSYIALLPTEDKSVIRGYTYNGLVEYTFEDGIKANNVYYKVGIDGLSPLQVDWEYKYDINGYQFKDLGLPSGTLWAQCNIGANNPWDYGTFHGWGTASGSTLNQDIISDISGNPKYDEARKKWGDEWRVPTKNEMYELMNRCTWRWVIWHDILGYQVIGPNKEWIFFPDAGYNDSSYTLGKIKDQGVSAYYWTSTPKLDKFNAYGMKTYQKNNAVTQEIVEMWRSDGLSIRPVISKH